MLRVYGFRFQIWGMDFPTSKYQGEEPHVAIILDLQNARLPESWNPDPKKSGLGFRASQSAELFHPESYNWVVFFGG